MLVLPLDVVDLGAMPAAGDSVMESYSRIDLLIINAGVGVRDFCTDVRVDLYRRALEVNLIGPIALT